MREGERRAVADFRRDVVAVDVGLQLVRRAEHDEVGLGRGIGDRLHLELGVLRLLRRGGAGAERDHHVLHAGIAKVLRMRVALAAEADDRDLLALDEVHVRIAVVINAHISPFPLFGRTGRELSIESPRGF